MSGTSGPLAVVAVGVGVVLCVALALSGPMTVGSAAEVAAVLTVLAGFSVALAVVIHRKVGSLVMVLLTINTFLTPMNGLRAGSFMSLSDVFLVAAAFMVVTSQLLRPSVTYLSRFRPFLAALCTMAFGGMIATVVSADPMAGILDLVRFTLSTVGLLVVVAAWAPSRARLCLLVWAFALGAAASVVVGLVSASPFIDRAVGLTLHPNHLGMTSLLAVGGAVGLALGSGRASRKLALGIGALLVVGVLVSGSRAAFLGLLVFCLVFLLAMRNGRTVLKYVSLCLPLLLAVVLGFVNLPDANAFHRLFRGGEQTQVSDRERESLQVESVEQIRRRPVVGSGFDFARTAHSLYLQLWNSAGLTGLLGLLALVVVAIKLLIAAAAARDPLVAGMAAAYVGYLAAGVATNILWDRYVWLHLALGLALFASRPSGENETSAVDDGKRDELQTLRYGKGALRPTF